MRNSVETSTMSSMKLPAQAVHDVGGDAEHHNASTQIRDEGEFAADGPRVSQQLAHLAAVEGLPEVAGEQLLEVDAVLDEERIVQVELLRAGA